MHTDQPAVFVVIADVVQFIEDTSQPTKFFIYYEIKTEASTARIFMDAGSVDIDYRVLLEAEADIRKGTEGS